VSYFEWLPRWSYALHCTDEQHAMCSRELQSALIFRVEFSECIILGKLQQLY
jgi:hypothetical protein